MRIAIISASVRIGRNSHRVALFFRDFIQRNDIASVDLVDLNEYKFPIFEERLRNLKEPAPAAVEFGKRIREADGVIIVTPEYNGGYPASLKNSIDLLYVEWRRKPVAVATVSNGPFGGAQVTVSLVFSLWKIGAWVVPAMFPSPGLQAMYDESGVPEELEATEKRAKYFIDELMWFMKAKNAMDRQAHQV